MIYYNSQFTQTLCELIYYSWKPCGSSRAFCEHAEHVWLWWMGKQWHMYHWQLCCWNTTWGKMCSIFIIISIITLINKLLSYLYIVNKLIILLTTRQQATWIGHFQIEPYQGDEDDSAVNVIRLLCKQAWDDFPEVSNVTSATMYWGTAHEKIYCPKDYWIVALRVSSMIHDWLRMLSFAINIFCREV